MASLLVFAAIGPSLAAAVKLRYFLSDISGVRPVADGGGGFVEAVQARIAESVDACTRCGKCVEACPMVEPAGLDPANAVPIVTGLVDLLTGGPGAPDAERWAQVCTNSGKCLSACDYGAHPRLMVNMARIASMNLKKGEAEVRLGAQQYFNAMGRSTRTISRLQLSPELLERVAPKVRAADEYEKTPDIVFYTGCNVIKTPHIALLVLEVLDALGVSYEVMGGTATCCGIQQFKRGDAKVAGRLGFNTIDRLARPGASRVMSWCPSCFIQIGEVAGPAYETATGREMPFEIAPIAELFLERLDNLKKLFTHRVDKRVAIQERAAVPSIQTAVKTVLRAIPGLEVVELDVPVVSTQASHLSVLPQFKEEVRQREFAAAAEAGVTTIASIFHACHRDLVAYQPKVTFELLNFMELIGEAMGIHIPDLYKRLRLMGDIDQIIADSSELIAANGLDLDTVRSELADDFFKG
jgi:heterodisulfide reductase subunit D